MPGSEEECEYWAGRASTYDAEYRDSLGEPFEDEIRAWLVGQVTAGDEVLELGCGTGIFSAMIAGRVKHLTATDYCPEMLEQAKRRLDGCDNVRIQTEDACATSFADDAFSAVLVANLLHHAREPATVVRECRRVVRPGGRFLVVEYTGQQASPFSLILTVLRYLRHLGRPPEDHHHLSADDLAVLITDAGMVVQETTPIRQRRPRMTFTCLRATKAS